MKCDPRGVVKKTTVIGLAVSRTTLGVPIIHSVEGETLCWQSLRVVSWTSNADPIGCWCGLPISTRRNPTRLRLAERIWRLLQQHFTYRLVLELDQVRLLTSRLIAQLVQLHRRIEEHGGVMRLCGLSPQNCEVLHTCRLDDRLTPYQDRQAAIMGCERPRQPR